MAHVAQFLSRVNQRCFAIGRVWPHVVGVREMTTVYDQWLQRTRDSPLRRDCLPKFRDCAWEFVPLGFFCGVLQVTSKLKIAFYRMNTRRSCPARTGAPDVKRHAFKARRFGGIRSILFLFFRGLISADRRPSTMSSRMSCRRARVQSPISIYFAILWFSLSMRNILVRWRGLHRDSGYALHLRLYSR